MASNETPRNPFPTVDVIVETDGGIVLVERRNEPRGWALPGGFVDYGERLEDAARREAHEETGLTVELVELLGVYSAPDRDPRQHNVSVVYVGRASGAPIGGDDARRAAVYSLDGLPEPLCFDHARIVEDYRRWLRTGERPRPSQTGTTPKHGLDEVIQHRALAVARDALEATVKGRASRTVPGEEHETLQTPAACFVTLYGPDGSLRGCIGALEARRPLVSEIRNTTQMTATGDPRFPPVGMTEVDELSIGLSVLSPMSRVDDVTEIEPGRHGLCVVRGGWRGVLLPQVALEQGWDRETFLAQTCMKAQLSPEAWREHDTEIYVFDAQIIHEHPARS